MTCIEAEVIRVFPRDTNTDEMIAGKYKYDELDINKLAVHSFESIDPNFYADTKKLNAPIIVAGVNFGCGSSREQAPQVLKACGISCILAESFARIFYRNGYNIGLPLIECKDISKSVSQADRLKVDFDNGTILNLSTHENYSFKPIPIFMQELLKAGGLMNYLRRYGGYTD
jgi:3-isopropylmalate/(R)-2-methylmalate dehydratase small subunit